MGIFHVPCPQCGKEFAWFSGQGFDQRCKDCIAPEVAILRANAKKSLNGQELIKATEEVLQYEKDLSKKVQEYTNKDGWRPKED